LKLAFVGCGSAGRVLAAAWRRAGHELGGILTRGPESARAAVAAIGGGVPGGPLDDARVVVFATPDDVLATAAAAHRLRADQVALHLSGAHPSTVLAATGARTAGLHPLRAFADFDAALASLPETWCFVEGEAVAVAEGLARDLGGSVARLDTAAKTRYHAAAAIASNYVTTLLALAQGLFEEAGIPGDDARAALTALARGAVDNVARVGIPRALTGPCARGDVAVVRAHLDALEEPVRACYRALLAATLPVARAKGALSAEAAAALDALARGAGR